VGETLAEIQDRTFARSRPSTADSFSPTTRLSAHELEAYLDRRTFGVASTARPDGRPHAAMTSYYRRDEIFWLPTVADAVRVRNVEHQPWISLVIPEGDRDEHIMVAIEGTAELVAPIDAPSDVVGQVGEWAGVWIRLTAKRVLSYGAPNTRA
jgi:hypothetical protein